MSTTRELTSAANADGSTAPDGGARGGPRVQRRQSHGSPPRHRPAGTHERARPRRARSPPLPKRGPFVRADGRGERPRRRTRIAVRVGYVRARRRVAVPPLRLAAAVDIDVGAVEEEHLVRLVHRAVARAGRGAVRGERPGLNVAAPAPRPPARGGAGEEPINGAGGLPPLGPPGRGRPVPRLRRSSAGAAVVVRMLGRAARWRRRRHSPQPRGRSPHQRPRQHHSLSPNRSFQQVQRNARSEHLDRGVHWDGPDRRQRRGRGRG